MFRAIRQRKVENLPVAANSSGGRRAGRKFPAPDLRRDACHPSCACKGFESAAASAPPVGQPPGRRHPSGPATSPAHPWRRKAMARRIVCLPFRLSGCHFRFVPACEQVRASGGLNVWQRDLVRKSCLTQSPPGYTGSKMHIGLRAGAGYRLESCTRDSTFGR